MDHILQDKYFVEKLDKTILLFKFHEHDRDKLIVSLIKNVLFKNDIFYYLASSDDEISLFIENYPEINELKNLNCPCMSNYNIIKVFGDVNNITHIGIVSILSTILAQSHIPILYVNTFNNNYILLEHEYYSSAIKLFEKHGIHFIK